MPRPVTNSQMSLLAIVCLTTGLWQPRCLASAEVSPWRKFGRVGAINLHKKDYIAAAAAYKNAISSLQESEPQSEAKLDLFINLAETYRLNNQLDQAKAILDRLEPEIMSHNWFSPLLKARFLKRKALLYWSYRDSKNFGTCSLRMLQQYDDEAMQNDVRRWKRRASVLWQLIYLENWSVTSQVIEQVCEIKFYTKRDEYGRTKEMRSMQGTIFEWLDKYEKKNDWKAVLTVVPIVQKIDICTPDPASDTTERTKQILARARKIVRDKLTKGDLSGAEPLLCSLSAIDEDRHDLIQLWWQWTVLSVKSKQTSKAEPAIHAMQNMLALPNRGNRYLKAHDLMTGHMAICALLEARGEAAEELKEWQEIYGLTKLPDNNLTEADYFTICRACHRSAEIMLNAGKTDDQVVQLLEELCELSKSERISKFRSNEDQFLWFHLNGRIHLARTLAKRDRPREAEKILAEIMPQAASKSMTFYQRNLANSQLEICLAFEKLGQLDQAGRVFSALKKTAQQIEAACKQQGTSGPTKLFNRIQDFEKRRRFMPNSHEN